MIAILLAGGQSARVGIDKATLELHGEMLIERHLRQLRMAGVMDAVAVCNSQNEAIIRTRLGVRSVLQRGNSMSAAVLTGIEEAHDDDVCAVCVNDIVSDEDYLRIFAPHPGDVEIVIPTQRLERTFSGGYLELDSATGAVRRIVERGSHGCPPGSAANIMIHQIRGGSLQRRLAVLLRAGLSYEAAVNVLIAEGARAAAVPVHSWVAIKTPPDIARAQAAAAQ